MTPIAIQTTYYGPTNNRGARIRAFGEGRKTWINYPYEMNNFHAHESAVNAWVQQHIVARQSANGFAKLISATSPDGNGWIFIGSMICPVT